MIFEDERLDGLALFVITTVILYLLGWHFMTTETYGPITGIYTDDYKCFNIGTTCVGFEFYDPIINIPILSKMAVGGGVFAYLVSLKKIIFG